MYCTERLYQQQSRVYLLAIFVYYNEKLFTDFRGLSSLPETKEDVAQDVAKRSTGRRIKFQNPALEYRHVYPEFLPDPNPKWRNTLREKMERADMLKRRSQIDIPEFYVGMYW